MCVGENRVCVCVHTHAHAHTHTHTHTHTRILSTDSKQPEEWLHLAIAGRGSLHGRRALKPIMIDKFKENLVDNVKKISAAI